MKAFLNLRYLHSDRAEFFKQGIKAAGFTEICHGLGIADALITWNRIGAADNIAAQCESRGIPVIVCENRSWGELVPGQWLHLSRSRHNTAGMFPIGDASRWDELGIPLEPFRSSGETVVLAQRGIGSAPTAQPRGWQLTQPGRLRMHPGRGTAQPLREDLAKCGKVITWGSAAAVEALAMGIPVESHMPNWIGQQDNTESGRLAMFQRLAWAQWRLDEIRSGMAFQWLLK